MDLPTRFGGGRNNKLFPNITLITLSINIIIMYKILTITLLHQHRRAVEAGNLPVNMAANMEEHRMSTRRI